MKKRLLSLVLSVSIIMALMPSFANTENGYSPLSSVTYEIITAEARNCISKDLSLPETIGEESISWSSSNSSVISNAGTVIRPESEPAEVTLTAAVGSESKEFVFTVMPENYYVNYSDSFDYSEYENSVITNFLTEWKTRWGNASYPSSKFALETLSDGSTNCYIRNEMWKDRPQYVLNGIKPSGKITVSYMVYMDIADDMAGMYDFEFDFGGDSNAQMRFYFKEDNTISEVRYYGGKPSGESLGASVFNDMNLRRRWVKMDWEIDTDSQKLWLYIDGTLVSKEEGLESAKMAGPLKRIDFNIGTNVVDMVLGIDDVSVVTKYDDIDEKEIVDVYTLLSHENFSSESEFAVTENLDLSRAVPVGYEDVTVTFESGSDNLTINGDIGQIVRTEEDAEAILYAAVSKDSTDFSQTKTFKFNVKGTNYRVYTSESFYYPDLVGKRASSASGGWGLEWTTEQDGLLDSAYVKETGNHSVMGYRTASDTSLDVTDSNYFRYRFSDASKRDVTIETRMKVGKAIDTQQIYNLNLYGKYEGVSVSKSFTQMHIYASESSTSMRISCYNPLTDSNASTALISNFESPDEWFDFKMEIDMFNKTINIYVNDKCVTPSPVHFMKVDGVDISAKTAEISYFSANPFRSIPKGEIYIDDFTAYSTRGMTADVALYKNSEKVTDLGYLTAGDVVSADVQLYDFEENMTLEGASVIVGIYSGKKLYDVAMASGQTQDGLINVSFPSLEIPDSIEDVKMKVFFADLMGNLSPVRVEYSFPHKLNGRIVKNEYTDEDTGRTYYTIDLNGEDALRSYYTMTTWAKNANKFYFYDNQYRLYEYDIDTGEYRYIDSLCGQNLVMVSRLGNVFYITKTGNIVRMDTETKAKEVVGALPENMNIGAAGLLQVNDDETYLSLEITENSSSEFDVSKKKRIPVMDINTGEWDLRYIHGFDTKVYAPNHMNINPNPEYSNLVAFAHEGTGDNGEGNPERIWLLDRDTGEYVNLFKQKMSYDRVPAETVSHEAWMQSGELMMFANDSKTTPGGITLFKKDGTDRRYVNSDYSYLHPSGSSVTDRFVISDTAYNGSVTQLVLIDCYTGKSYLLATLPQNGKDPGHTHPSFSRDGKKVIFGLYSEELSTIRVGWMDISDIIESAEDGEEITLSESCGTTSYGGTDFRLERKTISGAEFYNIASGNHMNVNITAFEKETANVNITFDYVDSGTDNVVIEYVKWETVNGKNKIVNYSETIARTNTGGIKTANVTLSGINAENLKVMGTDFTIKGAETDLAVKNISVTEVTQ